MLLTSTKNNRFKESKWMAQNQLRKKITDTDTQTQLLGKTQTTSWILAQTVYFLMWDWCQLLLLGVGKRVNFWAVVRLDLYMKEFLNKCCYTLFLFTGVFSCFWYKKGLSLVFYLHLLLFPDTVKVDKQTPC